jgi:TonB-dependent SusC/RagA subfamily outer membrane receptor
MKDSIQNSRMIFRKPYALGDRCEKFEQEFARMFNTKYAASVSSGTASIYWNWTNPTDLDFSSVIIYLDGVRIDYNEVVGFGIGGQGVSMLSTINPKDIENIEILKGPSAAAMYGTSGSNGVVLITTKTGKLVKGVAGKPYSIEYQPCDLSNGLLNAT